MCIPISLGVGVGIQLTFFPWQPTPDSGLIHFLSSTAQWTPVVTVIEGSQIFCGHSVQSSCSLPVILTWSNAQNPLCFYTLTRELIDWIAGSKIPRYLLEGFIFLFCFFVHGAVPVLSQQKPWGVFILISDDNKGPFQAMSSVPHGSHWHWFLVCFGWRACIGVARGFSGSLARHAANASCSLGNVLKMYLNIWHEQLIQGTHSQICDVYCAF